MIIIDNRDRETLGEYLARIRLEEDEDDDLLDTIKDDISKAVNLQNTHYK